MTAFHGMQMRTFEMEFAMYFARQDRIVSAAAEAIVGLGSEALQSYDTLVAIDTRLRPGIDGCVFLTAKSEEEDVAVEFLLIEAKWARRWTLQKYVRVNVHWAISDTLIASVLQACDPTTLTPASSELLEPLTIVLSRRFPDKMVAGCRPGYSASVEVLPDGTAQIGMYRDE